MKGKIVKGIAGFYYVNDGENHIYTCKARGAFRNRKVKPLVGDDVAFTVLDEADMEGNIEEILPRKNALVRPAGANIDQALVMFALLHPDPPLNLLDRFLVMMQTMGLPSIVCFNKADLSDGSHEAPLRSAYTDAGVRLHFISIRTGTGVEGLMKDLVGKTTILAGPSGVGKSSLMNTFIPGAGIQTGDISRKIERGRHTTRHSELFYICPDTYCMDTPGFSTFDLPILSQEELKACFPEFAPYEAGCRFLGCAHLGERDCAVKEALAQGKIAKSRWENYKAFSGELKMRRRY